MLFWLFEVEMLVLHLHKKVVCLKWENFTYTQPCMPRCIYLKVLKAQEYTKMGTWNVMLKDALRCVPESQVMVCEKQKADQYFLSPWSYIPTETCCLQKLLSLTDFASYFLKKPSLRIREMNTASKQCPALYNCMQSSKPHTQHKRFYTATIVRSFF